jgi:hypothetical protein
MATPYDDLNQHDIQAILDNAAGVIREVEQGSTHYSPEQYQEVQDTERELTDYLKTVDGLKVTMKPLSGSEVSKMAAGTYAS